MRFAIIAPAAVTDCHGICGVIMRQFYDSFMKKARPGRGDETN
ncbi:hypothetical protein EPIR_1008 [Erwinia piriflorinigrans CFBP 5888]|uniref:Uncharacterized protein n=1 Tax=Erwinia piriflorinigrans CFBP 5888 TaxID=1161919 RepID=V5Z503_9GAMM|nr:hypothetical protein EPIR_1008 [Erwinia piriflorinigrans CFBP 5888]